MHVGMCTLGKLTLFAYFGMLPHVRQRKAETETWCYGPRQLRLSFEVETTYSRAKVFWDSH